MARSPSLWVEPGELVYVDSCDERAGVVRYRGPALPSSEAILHQLVLRARPQAGAVVHAHDPVATREALLRERLAETPREEPYGTVALAQLAIAAFRGAERIIVLKNHGYVCVGAELEEAVDIIVATHLRLLSGG